MNMFRCEVPARHIVSLHKPQILIYQVVLYIIYNIYIYYIFIVYSSLDSMIHSYSRKVFAHNFINLKFKFSKVVLQSLKLYMGKKLYMGTNGAAPLHECIMLLDYETCC